jgi:vacuolar-type H+-ATPase subunit C/Vma6
MPITEAHDRYLQVLFDKIRQDKYPSGEMMDRIEIVLDREHVDEYLDLLFEKVEECRYPSKQLLDRIVRFTLSGS